MSINDLHFYSQLIYHAFINFQQISFINILPPDFIPRYQVYIVDYTFSVRKNMRIGFFQFGFRKLRKQVEYKNVFVAISNRAV
jgi:hypothetical protein